MKITELMHESIMNLELKATNKEDVIDELIEMLDASERISNKKKFKKAIMDREALSSTGVGEGVAIPHAQVRAVKEPSIVFGYSAEGLDYQAVDGEKSHLFFMIAAAKGGADLHLQALSKLARLLMKQEFKTELLKTKTKEGVLELINRFE
jgi:PTS system fructose-specific IIC component